MPEAALNESIGCSSQARVIFKRLPNIIVTAVADVNKHLTYSGVNSIGPLPKGCSIHFRVENAECLPIGTTVDWMARNAGTEAEAVNDMGHRGRPGFAWDDRSAYVGTHCMDVTFRQNSRLLGVRRVPVLVSGTPAARRNPRKPAWITLRGSR